MKLVALAVLAGTLAAGCTIGESGVPPEYDSLFSPSGLAVDPGGGWLYAVNSNSDLRFNAGTVMALDLGKTREDRARTDWGSCVTPEFVPYDKPATRYCCHDFFDPTILNCDERAYTDPATTVRIGSIGGAAIVQSRGANERRLFFTVRADPSITYVDVTLGAGGINMHCSDSTESNPQCDDRHRIRGDYKNDQGLRMPEEPAVLAVDDTFKTLYVGHGSDAVSVIDLCPDAQPTLVSVTTPAFNVRGQGLTGVTSLLLDEPGNAGAPLYITGHNFYVRSAAEIRSVYIEGSSQPCAGAPRPALTLVPSTGLFSSALYMSGLDIRSMLFSPDHTRAYVLHRNGTTRDNPSAVVAIDRTLDASGQPKDQSIGAVEVCAGGTEMHWHDAGKGPHLYVVCFESGQIYVVDPDLLTISGVINVGRGPSTMVFSPLDPTIAYLTGFIDNDISVISLNPVGDLENRVIQRIGFPHTKGH